MKVVFVATGDIALPTWHWLKNSRHEVVALVTQPDKPAGRKMQLTPPAIKRAALDAGVLVLQPESLRKRSAIDQVAALAPDLIVVMAYGQILTERFLQIAPVGCINLHASLLPKYRGASCIQAAIDAGDAETGITVMHMVKQLDAGDVICQKSFRSMVEKRVVVCTTIWRSSRHKPSRRPSICSHLAMHRVCRRTRPYRATSENCCARMVGSIGPCPPMHWNVASALMILGREPTVIMEMADG